MTRRHFIIATAGHVDHGKSALVRALTGTDPDRLPEEKARGITIDLGFAELSLIGSNGEPIHAGIVDVPGHESLVRNMIAGVGSINLAVLAVAADDGWMPQTEEHLQILTYVGVDRLIVALTKSDLGDVGRREAEVRHQLSGTIYAQALIIATSIRTGAGLSEFRMALASELSTAPTSRDISKPRLFVDRAFTLHGIGTIVTGTLWDGSIRRGQNVFVQPRGWPARVRSIQNHGRMTDFTGPGTRTAINLADTSVGTSGTAVGRGDVVCGDQFEPSSIIEARLERSSRLKPNTAAGRSIKSGLSVYLHHGTMRIAAKMILAGTDSLQIGETGIAQLRLDSPIVAFIGDRFVIRDRSEQHTLAGGIVLDAGNRRQNVSAGPHLECLKARATAPADPDVCVLSELEEHGFVSTSSLLIKSRFSSEEISASVQNLVATGRVELHGDIVAGKANWDSLIERARELINQAHATNPQQAGLDVNELRRGLGPNDPALFEAILTALCGQGFVRRGSFVARTSHRASLPEGLQAIAKKLETTLSVKPFDPPSRKELISTREEQQALSFLLEQGEVIELGTDALVLRTAFVEMKQTVAAFIATNGPATVSQLRQALGTSRRIAVPLLEYLDRARFTRRIGDRRNLANEPMTTASSALN